MPICSRQDCRRDAVGEYRDRNKLLWLCVKHRVELIPLDFSSARNDVDERADAYEKKLQMLEGGTTRVPDVDPQR